MQQAFEWEHLAWIVYPYFWGRRTEWSRTVVTSHPDPDFASFLNAGAARVQVPVRPGFEDLVKHFMETGEVYGEAGCPKMGDPGYVSFIDEQLTSLGAPGDEVPGRRRRLANGTSCHRRHSCWPARSSSINFPRGTPTTAANSISVGARRRSRVTRTVPSPSRSRS